MSPLASHPHPSASIDHAAASITSPHSELVIPTITHRLTKKLVFFRQVIDRFGTFAKSGNLNTRKKAINLGPASWNQDVIDVQWPKYAKTNPVFAPKSSSSTVIENGDAVRCAWLRTTHRMISRFTDLTGKFAPLLK
jgi:hypothetical protein